jgi:hypothetical protein
VAKKKLKKMSVQVFYSDCISGSACPEVDIMKTAISELAAQISRQD